MPAPVASGWSGRRVGLAPTGKAPPCHGAHPERSFGTRLIRSPPSAWASAKARPKVAILSWNLPAGSAFGTVGGRLAGSIIKPMGREQWDCPGNKVRSHREQSAGSSCPNRCPRDCCTPSRCAGACACASAGTGSPIASTSSCSSNPAAIRWPTSRRPTSLQTLYNAPSIPPGTTISGSRPGTPSGRASSSAPRGAWQHIDLPAYASELQARVAFAWPAMDAFYEEDERIVGHAADSYHRIDIRQASRNLVVRHRDRIIADTKRPLVLYESGFAPRWYVPRADIDESALTPWNTRPSARTKGCAATTTSVTHVWRHGRIVTPILRSAASPTWCRSSRTSSRYSSMAPSSVLSRVRR